MRTTGWLSQATILIILVLISDYSQGKTRAGAMGSDKHDQVTIVAKEIAGQGQLDARSLQRLVAWKKGDVYLQKHGYSQIGFKVEKVIAGQLHDPDYAQRPVGVNTLQVTVINEAAIALKKFEHVEGEWILQKLPDESYFVSELANTPFRGRSIHQEKEEIRKMIADLNSGNPKQQNEALGKLKDLKCMQAIGPVISLIDNQTKVTDPHGMRVHMKGGCKSLPVETTLDKQARQALSQIIGPLKTRFTPKKDAPKIAWKKWWKEVLATNPFPKVQTNSGKSKDVIKLAMNQTHPEAHLSPLGDRAIISFSRLQKPVDNSRSGILLIDIEQSKKTYLYQVPLKDRNLEPSGLTVAWAGKKYALAWKEYSHDDVKFLSSSAKKPVSLGLKKVSHLALAPLDSKKWVLACTAKKDGNDDKTIFFVVFDSTGKQLQKTKPLQLSTSPSFGYHDGIRALTMTATPLGPALTFVNENKGVFLLLLSKQLKVRKLVQVNDSKMSGHGFIPNLTSNKNTILTSWIQSDNFQDRFFARKFDLAGTPTSDVFLVSDFVKNIARPISDKNDFYIAWTDFSQSPNQVRIRKITGNKNNKKDVIALDSRHHPAPIELGVFKSKIKLLFCDRNLYPYRFIVKEIK